MKRDPACRILLILLATLLGPAAALADHVPLGLDVRVTPTGGTWVTPHRSVTLPASLAGTPGFSRRDASSKSQDQGASTQGGSESTASSAPTPEDLCSGVTCDDGNPCTSDACDPATGKCVFTPTPGVTCNDGNSCTTGDACNGQGQCLGVPSTPGSPCSDGNPCTGGDICVATPTGAVVCQGTPKNCNDNNLCTTDSCDPATGACRNVAINCDDHDPCTDDRCNPTSGQCEHRPVDCDDSNACTADTCD